MLIALDERYYNFALLPRCIWPVTAVISGRAKPMGFVTNFLSFNPNQWLIAWNNQRAQCPALGSSFGRYPGRYRTSRQHGPYTQP
jgi:hypothetical protein